MIDSPDGMPPENPAVAEGGSGFSLHYPTMAAMNEPSTARTPIEDGGAATVALDYSSLRSRESIPVAPEVEEDGDTHRANVPESPKDYTFLQEESGRGGHGESFAAWAHENGLDDKTAGDLVSWANQNVFQPLPVETGSQALIEALGHEEAEAVARVASEAVLAHADEDIIEFLEASGLGNSPQLIRLIAKIARHD